MSLNDSLLTLPASPALALSVRAKALLFHDPLSQALLQQVERVARSDATVVVVGETGTGKELIARHIHTTSERRGPFVAVNCGAFTESLIDAELFGHEAGAFTGAQGARAGWFETAHGGTLFLDEIGDLPAPLQVKLLRVLQERQVVRLGSRKPISVDVRLVAATNIDLHQAVQAQKFRADLYYRLSVAPLSLPPLRDRPGDILPLARHFIGVYATRMGLPSISLSADSETALLNYAWPGNIRELENVMHFALIVCHGQVIQAADLKLVPIRLSSPLAGPWAAPAQSTESFEAPTASTSAATENEPADKLPSELATHFRQLVQQRTPDLFHRVEETLVRSTYAHCHNNQVHTARALGITRNTLRTLLKRYGLLASSAGDEAGGGEPASAHDADELESDLSSDVERSDTVEFNAAAADAASTDPTIAHRRQPIEELVFSEF